MFSDELEMLINAAIADGEISEKERAILHKRAQAEGVDTDELDMIVEARIAKAKKAVSDSQNKQNSNEETEPQEPTAAELLKIKIDIINNHHEGKGNELYDDRIVLRAGSKIEDIKYFKESLDSDLASNERARERAIVNAIKEAYVPKEKHEILDMIIRCKKSFESKLTWYKEGLDQYKKWYWENIPENLSKEGPIDNDIDLAYMSKGKEMLDMINIYFPEDPQLYSVAKAIEEIENNCKKLDEDLKVLKQTKKAEWEEKQRMKNPINMLKKLFGK